MVQENEVVMFIIGLFMLIFSTVKYKRLQFLPQWRYLYLGFVFLNVAWFFTIAEGFVWAHLFNVFEHCFYMLASFAMFLWTIKILFKKEEYV